MFGSFTDSFPMPSGKKIGRTYPGSGTAVFRPLSDDRAVTLSFAVQVHVSLST